VKSKVVKNEIMVGSFIAIGFVLAGLWATQRSRDKGLLDTHEINFVVDHGSGLESGAPVLMKGVEIGSIGDVELIEGHKVRVTCKIRPRFVPFVGEDTKAIVSEPAFLGSTKVELQPGTGPKASNHHTVKGEIDQGFTDRLENIESNVDSVVHKIDGVIDRADEALVQINDVAQRVKDGDGIVAQLLNDEELAADSKKVVQDLRGIAEEAREGKGAIALAINDEEFAKDLKTTAKDMREITDEVAAGKGSLGRLVKDAALVDESTSLIKDLRGSLAKLDELNVLAKDSMTKVGSLLTTTERAVKRVDGLVGDAGGVTAELTDALRRVNKGEGTIAALLNDDAVYRETKSLLRELRESVEDLREQAPINSFLGVVFSAF
jgi:phospholipid/cholesterol/gamma-HCH transport system substrate-binding protein